MSQEVFLFQVHPTGLSFHVMHMLLLVGFGYLNVIDSLGLSLYNTQGCRAKQRHYTSVFTDVDLLPLAKQKLSG